MSRLLDKKRSVWFLDFRCVILYDYAVEHEGDMERLTFAHAIQRLSSDYGGGQYV